ncbi:MmyB family transcriptional regulator [Streptosporangium sp. NBC_01495]|uniref:MmyB family transcriptional regulator n=1 Tax=Streptosporangium sp. NBC_01495 TaxID=2903899 RepID=UPI003FCC7233
MSVDPGRGRWNLISWNRLWAALFGDPSLLLGRDRNVIWRHFTGRPGRVSHTPEQETRFEMAAVADLRSATARYPADTDLRSFVTDLRSLSPRFAELWDTHVVGIHESDHKIVHHPDVGTLTLDCDMLTVPGSDLRIITYSTAPDTDSADRLKLLSVIGTQTMWPSRSSSEDLAGTMTFSSRGPHAARPRPRPAGSARGRPSRPSAAVAPVGRREVHQPREKTPPDVAWRGWGLGTVRPELNDKPPPQVRRLRAEASRTS